MPAVVGAVGRASRDIEDDEAFVRIGRFRRADERSRQAANAQERRQQGMAGNRCAKAGV
jgi:hypothetical protein